MKVFEKFKHLCNEAFQSGIPDGNDPDWERFNRISAARWKVIGIVMGLKVVLFVVVLVAGLAIGR